LEDGVNVVVLHDGLESQLTVPETGVLPPARVKLVAGLTIVLAFMGAPKVALTVESKATPAAPLTGTVEATRGCCVTVNAAPPTVICPVLTLPVVFSV
jgi:hypothetical protein